MVEGTPWKMPAVVEQPGISRNHDPDLLVDEGHCSKEVITLSESLLDQVVVVPKPTFVNLCQITDATMAEFGTTR